jgi:hypothetical protein
MTFKQFYVLRESPDIVYPNSNKQLRWDNKDARAFGWVNAIPEISPFLLYTVCPGATHFELIDMVFSLLESSKTGNIQSIKTTFKKEYSRNFNIYPSFAQILDQIVQNKTVWKNILNKKTVKQYYKNLESGISLADEKPITTQMTERTVGFTYSGRIWLKSKVISFWATRIQPNIIHEVFDAYKISSKERFEFLIDLINPSDLSKEETKDKTLPTVKEYIETQSPLKKLTKKQEQDIAELMSKRHTESDPIKRKQIKQELEGIGQSAYQPNSTLSTPLYIKQKVLTSENQVKDLI